MEIELAKEVEERLPEEARSLIRIEYRSITEQLTGLTVTNEEKYKAARELGIRNRDVLNRIESFRKAIVKPFQDAVKNTNDLFKKISSKFEESQLKIDSACSKYISSRKTTESIQNVRDEGGIGRATLQKRMKFQIVDANLVPREWLCPDEVQIGKAVRARLVKEIPGVKIWEETITAYATE